MEESPCKQFRGDRHKASFQTDDLDAFDSYCDDAPSAKAVLIANLSSYDSNVLSWIPFHDTNIENDTSYQKNPVVQDTSSPAQQPELYMSVIEEISSPAAKCNKVQQENLTVNETLTAELERYKEQVKLFKERYKFDLNDRDKYIDGKDIKVKKNKKTSKNRQEMKRQVQERDLKPNSKPDQDRGQEKDKRTKEKDYFALTMEDEKTKVPLGHFSTPFI
ncbi:hypothetical protein Tco_1517782 [Tanacetum coccineum]